jgi:putative exporter of polyketide antibiotics
VGGCDDAVITSLLSDEANEQRKETFAMQRIVGFVAHLVGAMLKGFFFTGMAAAIVCVVALVLTEPNHQVTLDTSLAFGLVIVVLAGVLGAAVALIYHLSHLDTLHHAARYFGERHASQPRAHSSSPARR